MINLVVCLLNLFICSVRAQIQYSENFYDPAVAMMKFQSKKGEDIRPLFGVREALLASESAVIPQMLKLPSTTAFPTFKKPKHLLKAKPKRESTTSRTTSRSKLLVAPKIRIKDKTEEDYEMATRFAFASPNTTIIRTYRDNAPRPKSRPNRQSKRSDTLSFTLLTDNSDLKELKKLLANLPSSTSIETQESELSNVNTESTTETTTVATKNWTIEFEVNTSSANQTSEEPIDDKFLTSESQSASRSAHLRKQQSIRSNGRDVRLKQKSRKKSAYKSTSTRRPANFARYEVVLPNDSNERTTQATQFQQNYNNNNNNQQRQEQVPIDNSGQVDTRDRVFQHLVDPLKLVNRYQHQKQHLFEEMQQNGTRQVSQENMDGNHQQRQEPVIPREYARRNQSESNRQNNKPPKNGNDKDKAMSESIEMNYNYQPAQDEPSPIDPSGEGLPYYNEEVPPEAIPEPISEPEPDVEPEVEPDAEPDPEPDAEPLAVPEDDVDDEEVGRNIYNNNGDVGEKYNVKPVYDDDDAEDHDQLPAYPQPNDGKKYDEDKSYEDKEYMKQLLEQFIKQLEVIKSVAVKELRKDGVDNYEKYEKVMPPADGSLPYDDYQNYRSMLQHAGNDESRKRKYKDTIDLQGRASRRGHTHRGSYYGKPCSKKDY